MTQLAPAGQELSAEGGPVKEYVFPVSSRDDRIVQLITCVRGISRILHQYGRGLRTRRYSLVILYKRDL